MARITINNINKAIRAAGSDFEIFNGNGYFYFMSPTTMLSRGESVYCQHLTTYTVAEWLDRLQKLIDETNQFAFTVVPSLVR